MTTMNTRTLFSSFGLAYAKYVKTSARDVKLWSPLRRPVIPFKLTDIGEGIREVTVKQTFIQQNQRLSQFDDVVEVESDKAAVTITSRYDGEVKQIYFKEGDVIAVGAILCDIHVEDETATEDTEKVATITPPTPPPSTPSPLTPSECEEIDALSKTHFNKVLTTPAVRRIARENNIDLSTIKGSGKGGRISKEDILVYLNQPSAESFTPIFTDTTKEVAQTLTGYQKVMIRTMTESNRIPALGLSDEIDVTELEALRKKLKSEPEQNDVKLTLLAFIVKAVSLALKKYPILNSTFDGNVITYQIAHNIGIAVDTTVGLVVPNIKNVHTLSVRDIAKDIGRLQKLSAEGKLSLADTSNGTFTISNIGAIAGTIVKPLILPPQVAIVGIGRIQALPRYDSEDELCKRLLVNVSWAADHRIIDGATVGRFSNLVKRYLERPGYMALDAERRMCSALQACSYCLHQASYNLSAERCHNSQAAYDEGTLENMGIARPDIAYFSRPRVYRGNRQKPPPEAKQIFEDVPRGPKDPDLPEVKDQPEFGLRQYFHR